MQNLFNATRGNESRFELKQIIVTATKSALRCGLHVLVDRAIKALSAFLAGLFEA